MLLIHDGKWYRVKRFGEIQDGDSYMSISVDNNLDGVRTVEDGGYNPGGFCGAFIVEKIATGTLAND